MNKTFYTASVLAFVILSAVFFWMKSTLPEYRFMVLMGGNIIMFLLSVFSFTIVTKNMQGKPGAFVRSVNASTFLKLFVCIVSILIYALVNKPDIHKPSLFILFGIYIVYTAIETVLLSKTARTGN